MDSIFHEPKLLFRRKFREKNVLLKEEEESDVEDLQIVEEEDDEELSEAESLDFIDDENVHQFDAGK